MSVPPDSFPFSFVGGKSCFAALIYIIYKTLILSYLSRDILIFLNLIIIYLPLRRLASYIVARCTCLAKTSLSPVPTTLPPCAMAALCHQTPEKDKEVQATVQAIFGCRRSLTMSLQGKKSAGKSLTYWIPLVFVESGIKMKLFYTSILGGNVWGQRNAMRCICRAV